MISPRPPLSAEARRLDAIRQRLEGDSLLQVLLAVASGSEIFFDLPIAMLVNGTLVRGRVARPEFVAEHIDSRLAEIASTANLHVGAPGSTMTQDQLARIREALSKALSTAFADNVTTYRMRDREASDHLEAALGTVDT